ncbi:uncharacterized protein F4807DRAFT_417147 [Annulohypoxylon truncatum]|uniref:uncharacterized protein n=1 Tax=Annulohypoxylon truncatum TaxID=327061 RepID=UPI0020086BCC|nr:uncharacterized protein F4807DRAFT_417147 [Annulohypoxylon truncatum]KAI1211989.1 hypothetical protein F4807DRAFT_417147 [Annulohypoxylon truncatum]
MASTGNPTSGLSREAQAQHSTSSAGKTNITNDGTIVSTADPTVNPSATAGQKLKGDVGGAVSGSIGSMQAATGAVLRNKGMEEKGLAKMQAEDERLGAKRGVMPVGSGQRHTTEQTQATSGPTDTTGTTGTTGTRTAGTTGMGNVQ